MGAVRLAWDTSDIRNQTLHVALHLEELTRDKNVSRSATKVLLSSEDTRNSCLYCVPLYLG